MSNWIKYWDDIYAKVDLDQLTDIELKDVITSVEIIEKKEHIKYILGDGYKRYAPIPCHRDKWTC